MTDSDQIMVDSAQIDACLHAPFTRDPRVFTRPFHASGTRVFNFEFRVKGKGRERKEGKGIKRYPIPAHMIAILQLDCRIAQDDATFERTL